MFEVQPLGEGWYLVSDGRTQSRVAVAGDAQATWVFIDGQTKRLAMAAPAGRARGTSRGEAGVMSPMPATVVALHAAPGRVVAEGEIVIVLEAMKMELPIKAPRAGVVKAVHCVMGELVQPGVSLLEIE